MGGKWSLRCTRSRARFPPLRLKLLIKGKWGASGGQVEPAMHEIEGAIPASAPKAPERRTVRSSGSLKHWVVPKRGQ